MRNGREQRAGAIPAPLSRLVDRTVPRVVPVGWALACAGLQSRLRGFGPGRKSGTEVPRTLKPTPLAVLLLLAALSAAAAVPTPASFFGHEIGADKTVLDWDKVVSWFRLLEKS